MTETNPTGSSIILNGDVIEQLQAFDDNTFDACLSDPPYLLEFMGKDFDRQHLAMEGENDGQKMYQWHLGWCRELYRVLKPGAFVMVFGGTRTSHRLACALEDVGFEIRDTVEWMYGSGFPKSHDISKGIDKLPGNEREIVGIKSYGDGHIQNSSTLSRPIGTFEMTAGDERKETSPGSEQSALWSGYGTALKPAHEPLILCMKPFNGTFAENALEHGVAGLNIDGCRIKHSSNDDSRIGKGYQHRAKAGLEIGSNKDNAGGELQTLHNPSGRWPANLILSHTPYCQERIKSKDDIEKSLESKRSIADVDRSELVEWDCHPLCPVRLLDEQSGNVRSSGHTNVSKSSNSRALVEDFLHGKSLDIPGVNTYSDRGGASRFFYCAKVSTRERNAGNIDCKHPTLKPIDLCRYLATLLLPPSREDDPRQIIVPFSGAGSEMAGALSAGWDMVIGIEMDREYIKWAKARIPDLSSGKLQSQSQPRKPKPKLLPDEDYNLDIFS